MIIPPLLPLTTTKGTLGCLPLARTGWQIKQSVNGNVSFASLKLTVLTVVCLVAWPLNEIEVRVDFVLIETSQYFSYVNSY